MGAKRFTKDEEKRIIVPVVERLEKQHRKGSTTIVGIQGGQGTGKTTIVKFLENHLKRKGFKVKSFSIDDFYKTWKERKKLQEKYSGNAFYQIPRGLPGTHRVKELFSVLKKAKSGKPFEIPTFDKSLYQGKGDVLRKTLKVKERQDFIFLEGWCVGLPEISSQKLMKICKRNKIDLKKLDPKLKDHKVVLKLVKDYQKIWELFDYMMMLKADSVEVHKKWRLLQEKRLKKEKGEGMSRKEITSFVEPYLPFTYVCYDLIRADVKVLIDENHNFYRITFLKPKQTSKNNLNL